MKISALALQGDHGWPDLELKPIASGLSCYYGPRDAGKSTVADLLGQALYGKQPAPEAFNGATRMAPEGEVIIESIRGHFRLRRYQDGTPSGRLTVASLDLSPVHEHSVAELLGGLSPAVLSRLAAVSFDESPASSGLVEDFVRQLRALEGNGPESGRRTMELAARRDALAQELETRIAAERRMSGDLDSQSRVLDRLIRDEQRETAALEQRLRAVEASLAETDARLRYRRLELNTELRWNATESEDVEPELAELDEQIARWRTMLGELANRESAVRARLAQARPGNGACATTVTDQRAWLAVARQLTADLEGEVARLARATASDQCVCRDAHPRLRPIVETAQRQLDVLDALVQQQDRGVRAAALQQEIAHLGRSQVELRGQLEHLLDRREALSRSAHPSRRLTAADASIEGGNASPVWFSAADAEQLEQRRTELEQERFELVQRVRTRQRQFRDLRAQRIEIDRERAALLSARSIEHVQRELADVQRRLERAAGGASEFSATAGEQEGLQRASDYLAQLTDGLFVRLELVDHSRRMRAVNRAGATLEASSLTASERDQLHLSLSLALTSAAARHGVHLPLVLDEPFARLDAGGTAALAAVLDHFSRQGHQVLVFTGQGEAVERLASLGCKIVELSTSRRRERETALPEAAKYQPGIDPSTAAQANRSEKRRHSKSSLKPRSAKNSKGKTAKPDRSDAA
jgi:hypothetical protein